MEMIDPIYWEDLSQAMVLQNALLYAMVEILLIFRTPFCIQTDESGTASKADSPLAPGISYVSIYFRIISPSKNIAKPSMTRLF